METEYNKKDKTLVFPRIEDVLQDKLASYAILYSKDKELVKLKLDGDCYTFGSDGIYELELKYYNEDNEEISIERLGSFLVIEYTKDKNRKFLCSILDNESFYELPKIYSQRVKVIRELENSYYIGNLGKVEILFKEIAKWTI